MSPSGYYAWKRRQPSQRQQHDVQLGAAIEQIYQESRRTYGSPRLQAELHAQGIGCGRKRVMRLMRQRHLCAQRTRHRCRTTDSQHTHPVAPNVLARDFTAHRPNEKWVADSTGVWTHEGWLYVALVLDVYSRLIVGWAMAATRDEGLVHAALRMALLQRQPDMGLVHHSDRGSQYTSHAYRTLLASWGQPSPRDTQQISAVTVTDAHRRNHGIAPASPESNWHVSSIGAAKISWEARTFSKYPGLHLSRLLPGSVGYPYNTPQNLIQGNKWSKLEVR